MCRKKMVLIGEPMGLFIAEEPGALSEVKKFSASVAGAEYNVAVGLTRLGHTALFCTKLGADPHGERILASMVQNGIATELVLRDTENLTGYMLKSMVTSGDPEIFYYRKQSAASAMTPQDIDHLDLSGCEYLHITGVFPAVSLSARATVKRLIKRARALDMFVSFDPNLRPQLWPSQGEMVRTLNEFAQDADLVLPGIAEGLTLTGEQEPEGIAGWYHRLGVPNVIVKTGSKGAFHSCKDGESGVVPAFPVKKIVDTVGAGDGFAAGVLSALMEGLSLREAAMRGNVIGAVQITHKSDNEGLPDRAGLAAIEAKGAVG